MPSASGPSHSLKQHNTCVVYIPSYTGHPRRKSLDISAYGVSPNVDPIVQDLEKYDLMKHAMELEAYGMTVVPPEKMGVNDGFVERLRSAILGTCEKRSGIRINDHTTDEPDVRKMGARTWYLLGEDEAFAEAATNPRMLTLARWLCGQSACITAQTWIIKPPAEKVDPNPRVGLHSDAHGIPPGGGHIAHVCNASWLCTDYADAEDGPTVFVPGSHRYGRATLPHEAAMTMGDDAPFPLIPLIAKAGSLAIWHGATWHGSTPRTNRGLRVTLVQVFMRMHMRPHHLWEDVPPSFMDKYPELKRILGDPGYPFKESIDNIEGIQAFMNTGTDPYA